MNADTQKQGVAELKADYSSPMAFVLDVHAIVSTLLEKGTEPDLEALFSDLKAIRDGAEELINADEDAAPEEPDLTPRTVTVTLRRETVQVATQVVTFTFSDPEDLKTFHEIRKPPFTAGEHRWFISEEAQKRASATAWLEVTRRVDFHDPTDIVIDPPIDAD